LAGSSHLPSSLAFHPLIHCPSAPLGHPISSLWRELHEKQMDIAKNRPGSAGNAVLDHLLTTPLAIRQFVLVDLESTASRMVSRALSRWYLVLISSWLSLRTDFELVVKI
jgi:hypothetical protein